jgi:DNA-binding transcriptional regulator YiaG
MTLVTVTARPGEAPLSPREIRRLRGGMGMTQPQFAQLLRAHPSTVSRWEAEGTAVAPDAWQQNLMRAFCVTCTRKPEAADDAIAYLAVGAVAGALGALLAVAIADAAPPKRKRARRTR